MKKWEHTHFPQKPESLSHLDGGPVSCPKCLLGHAPASRVAVGDDGKGGLEALEWGTGTEMVIINNIMSWRPLWGLDSLQGWGSASLKEAQVAGQLSCLNTWGLI